MIVKRTDQSGGGQADLILKIATQSVAVPWGQSFSRPEFDIRRDRHQDILDDLKHGCEGKDGEFWGHDLEFRAPPTGGRFAPTRRTCAALSFVQDVMELQIHQQPPWVFDQLFDPHKEGYSTFAVDDPVVVAERDVHHRPDHNLSIQGHGTVLNFGETKDTRL